MYIFIVAAKERLRKAFDKDYAEQQRREKMESDIGNLQQLKERTDLQLTHLQECNTQILAELTALKETLDTHIQVDDERNADSTRAYILRFNIELVRELKHTREDFIEVLAKIDDYERYCRTHENYKNNRAISAIGNIKRVYNIRLENHEFL